MTCITQIKCTKTTNYSYGGGGKDASPIRPPPQPSLAIDLFHCILKCSLFQMPKLTMVFCHPEITSSNRQTSISDKECLSPPRKLKTQKLQNTLVGKGGSLKKVVSSCAELYPMEEVSMYPLKSGYK